jgi:hypothetical protein
MQFLPVALSRHDILGPFDRGCEARLKGYSLFNVMTATSLLLAGHGGCLIFGGDRPCRDSLISYY